MGFRWVASGLAIAGLWSCSPAAPDAQPGNAAAAKGNFAVVQPVADVAPAPAALAVAPLGEWLIGTWSYGDACASDLYLRFEKSGAIENSGDLGSWTLSGDTVTQTIAERFNIGDAEPSKLNPPEVRRFTVTRTDASHGVITVEGRKVPIRRC